MEENIYVGARESSSTSKLNNQIEIGPLADQDYVAEVNIEQPTNQQPHKNNQPDLSDVESDNSNDKTQKTVIDISKAKKIRFSNINNSLIVHLNINSTRNKSNELKIYQKI